MRVCTGVRACLFGCLHERERAAASIPHLPYLPESLLNAPQLYGGPFSDQWLSKSV